MAIFAFGAAGALACGENASKASADKAYSKSCRASSAKLASSKTASGSTAFCSAHDISKQAASTDSKDAVNTKATFAMSENALGFVSGHDKNCKIEGGCELVNIRIDGMTCGGCESGIKASLVKMAGINGVLNVSYQDKIAQVCTSKGFSKYSAVKAVEDKGFTAEIIPAVATTTTGTDAKLTRYGKSCSAADRAACAAKFKKAEKAKDAKESTSL